MPSKIVIDCAEAIASQKLNIAFVESATAGRMCSEFSLTPHSGDVLRGGISCYEVFIKEHILKIPPKLIKEVTAALAQHSSKIFKSDITVAVTGLTAPGGSETPEKPVGTMFLHILLPKGFIAHTEVYSGTPEEIILKTVDKAAQLIRDHLNKN